MSGLGFSIDVPGSRMEGFHPVLDDFHVLRGISRWPFC